MGQKIEKLPPYTRALLKSHLISAGYTYDDLNKPIIGIANSWNEFNHGHLSQKDLGKRLNRGSAAREVYPLNSIQLDHVMG